MKDRIPTKVLANGAIRYEVYTEQGVFLRYDYIKPGDEPSEVGTPLNKATLLSDGTAALYGLGAGAMPDEVLNVLGNIGAASTVFRSSGSFTANKTGKYIAEVVGGGGFSANTGYCGAGGGYPKKAVFLNFGDIVVVTVGTAATTNSAPGGTSSFGSYVSATGGSGVGGVTQSTPGTGIGGDINITGGKPSNGPGGSVFASAGGETSGFGVGSRTNTVFGSSGIVVITHLG